MKEKMSVLRILRKVLLALMMVTAVWTVFTPAQAYAIDHLIDILDPANYKTWEIKPKTESVDNDNWRVQLSNASCAIPIHLDLSAFIGEHNLYASVEMCTTTDFEIEFKKANWTNTNFNSDITKSRRLYKMDTFDTTDLNNIIGYIPWVGNLAGVVFKKQVVGAATAPCTVKGKFTVKAVYKVGYDEDEGFDGNFATAKYTSAFQITSIDPKDSGNNEVTAFVGDYEWLDSGFGKVTLDIKDFDILELGPVIQGKAGIFAGDVISFHVEKNKFRSDWDHQPNEEQFDVLHTCCDYGSPGCLTGKSRIVQQTWYNWSSHLRAEILDCEIFDFENEWGDDEDYLRKETYDFHQSLTFNEPLVYSQDPCSHHVYRVPVGVWANEAKTIAVDGITVKPEDEVRVDENVRKYTQDVSGTDGRGTGLATLYLPYREGRYTIGASGRGLKGSAGQPSDMKREKNDQVDIAVSSPETRTLSVRKEWDIDYENKDKPDSIQVLLQAHYYTHGKNIWERTYRSIMRVSSWEPVELVTLNAANNWQATFKAVPKYEVIGESGNMPVIKEIRYRIRELKAEDSAEADITGAVFEPDENGRILFDEDGDDVEWPRAEEYEQALPEIQNPNEEQKKLREAGRRVVHWRWDLDNVNVYSVIKKKLTNWDTYWQIDTDYQSYLKSLAKDMFFPLPTVTYKVPEYTSSVGERIGEHQTKYVVEYRNEGETTVIRDIACMDVAVYKRWLDFTEDEDIPEKVWLVLQSRIKDKYLEQAGKAGDHVPYLPVLKPLYGNMTSFASLIGLDIIAKFDVAGLLNTSIAFGQAKKKDNPLVSYRLKFGVRKYDLATKLPLDFEAGELTGEIIKTVVQAVTGLDIPISISLTGGGYVTIPGKAYNFFKDWELTSNVINIKADIDDDPAIGGVKYWKGEGWGIGSEDGDKLPEYIDIVVKDGDKEIGTVRLNKEDQTAGSDAWAWKLSQSDINEKENRKDSGDSGEGGQNKEAGGIELNPSRTYDITEVFPEDYQYKNSFVACIDGHNIINTWSPSPSLVIEKLFEDGCEPEEVQVKLTNDLGEEAGTYTLNEDNGYKVTLKDKKSEEETGGDDSGEDDEYTVELSGHDINAFKVEEIVDEDAPYVPACSGPRESDGEDGSKIYTFAISNRRKQNITVSVGKTWEDETEDSRPASIEVKLKRNGAEAASAVLSPANDWKAEITEDSEGNALPRFDENGAEYNYTLEEIETGRYRSKVTSDKSDGMITFTVTNTWQTDDTLVTVKGRKTWVDNSDAAGARPDVITIHVLAGSKSVRTIEADADDASWEVRDLPRFDEDGSEISYSVYEEEVEGYAAAYAAPSFDAGSRTWTCDVTNTYDTIQVVVRKVWEDDNDSRGLRPESIEVSLKAEANGGASRVVATGTLTRSSGWRYIFTGLKKEDRPGVPVTYSVEELPVENYHEGVVSGSMEEGYTITNTIDANMLTDKVVKEWEDSGNTDNTRPGTVTVHLTRNDEEYRTTVLSEENNWSDTFNDLPWKDDRGRPYEYLLYEEDIPGYTGDRETTYNGSNYDFITTFTNTLNPEDERISIPVKKVWEDGEDSAGARPGSITVCLMDGGTEVRRLTLTGEDNWQGTFENVPVYRTEKTSDDETGSETESQVEIEYTLQEAGVESYESEITGSAAEGFIITNTYVETARFTVTKYWDDDDSLERPSSVTVYLRNGSTVVETARITADDNWTYTFTDLPMKENGEEIRYTVSEEVLDHYEAEVGEVTKSVLDGVTVYRCTLTNRLKNNIRARFTVTKKWENDDGSEAEWPEGKTVAIRLMQNGEEYDSAVIGTDSGGSFSFESLSAADGEGHWYAYTVEEDDPGEYDVIIGALSSETLDDGTVEYRCEITNRASSRRTDIVVKKVWEDDDYSGRPASVRVHLLADGTDVEGSPVELSGDNDWKFTFADQPLYSEGIKIRYTVAEDEIGGNYMTPQITGSAERGFTVTNRRNTPGKTTYSIKKIWQDDDDARGLRPETLRVDLWYTPFGSSVGDRTVIDSVLLTAENADPENPNEWTYTFINLDPGFFSIEEEEIDGYINAGISSGTGAIDQPRTIANRINQLNTFKAKKIWKDENGEAITEGVPDSVRVNLIREASEGEEEKLIESAVLNADNNWSHTFAQVPAYSFRGSIPIRYKVIEMPVEGYTTTLVGGGNNTGGVSEYTFINTKIPKIEYTVEKEWEDEDDAKNKRSESVTVYLMNGDTVVGQAVLSETGDWKHTFADLPATDSAGTAITYTVEESDVPFYEAEYAYTEADGVYTGCTVTNRYVGRRVRFSMKAFWEDDNDVEGWRPDSVNAGIYSVENRGMYSYTLSSDAGYAKEVKNLPVPGADGVSPYYRAEQDTVEHYITVQNSPQVLKDTEDEIVIRQVFNNYANEKIRGRKTWAGEENEEHRPGSITIRLMRNDEEVDSKTVTAAEDWAWDFGEWPAVSEDGARYTYRIQEDPVPANYKAEVDGWNVTNTWDPEVVDVTVTKVWKDSNNQKRLRPASVHVCLKADGSIREEADLSEAGGWRAAFGKLPKINDEGREITYTVEENAVEYYTTEISGSADTGFTVTNTLDEPKIDIDVEKVWDGDNAAGRPGSVLVFLYADGISSRMMTLTAAENWQGSFEGLPKLNDEGDEITYTVKEGPLAKYHSSVTGSAERGFTITNTLHRPIRFQIPVGKQVEGEAPPAETFTFTLKPVSGNAGASQSEETLTITGSGTDSFEVNLDQTGLYFFTLTEKNDGSEGWDYDDSSYTILITVGEDQDGNLQASWKADGKTVDKVVFKNRYQSVNIDIHGKKTWEDDGDRAGRRPDSITIRLLADGVEKDSAVVTASDGWSWTFEDLPKMAGGKNITYTVREDPVEDYMTEINDCNVTNIYVTPPPPPPGDARLTVVKVWDEEDMPRPPETEASDESESGSKFRVYFGENERADDGDDSGDVEEEEFEWPKRPDSVTVRVYNGAELVGEAVLTERSRWKYTFEGLPYRDEGGMVIPYTVTEDFTEGYDTEISPVELEHGTDTEGYVYICTVTNKWTGNKTDIPTVTKKVKEKNDTTGGESEWQDAADYDIGDSIPCRITGTLPTRFEKFEQFTEYTFVDILSEGLNPPSAESVRVTKNGSTDLSGKFSIHVEGRTITVRLKDGQDMRQWEGEYALTAKDRIIIEYSAKLNSRAVIGTPGNPNAVRLTYTTEEEGVYGTDTTVEDKVTVFTYTIEAHKVTVDDGEKVPLEGAGFTLYKKVGGDWQQVCDEQKGSGMTTFEFFGIDAGLYKLVETTVPAGCNPADDVEITVVAYYDTESNNPQLKVFSISPPDIGFATTVTDINSGHISTDGVVSGEICNMSGWRLPSTGGPGTRGIYTAGTALLLTAAMLLRRRQLRQPGDKRQVI